MNTDNRQPENTKLIAEITANPLSVHLDYELYEHYLAECDLTEDQKREFLETLWSIIVGFVDLGFGVHPVQQVCGEPASPDTLSATWQVCCDKDKGLSNHQSQSNSAETYAASCVQTQEGSPE